MKAVILAGGLGSRLSEETHNKPKPMVEIGGKPILWHIMKIYASHNVRDFIVCCGYKKYKIDEYFKNFSKKNSNIKIEKKRDQFRINMKNKETWNVRLVNTGLKTLTGGRLKRVSKFLENDKFFFFTYGDGLAKFNMKSQINFHKKHNKICTVLSVRPPSRYGALEIGKNGLVKTFDEKPEKGEDYINGGFFILNPKCFEYISGDNSIWETNVLTKLAKKKQMMAFTRYDFWHPMDTLRDKNFLEKIWKKNKANWKNWK
jgi:glucose-1-phosphate cytidylyltransferase